MAEKTMQLLKTEKADALDPVQDFNRRMSGGYRGDGWTNVLTGLGQITRDKNMSTVPEIHFLDRDTLDALYQSDDIAARIVDLLVDEMLREKFKINIPDDEGKISDWIFTEIDRLHAMTHVEQLLKEGRLYGTDMLYYGIRNTLPAFPLDERKISRLDYLRVIDRFRLTPSTDVEIDLSSEDFGMPVWYEIRGGGKTLRIHRTWLYRFDGVELPLNIREKNQYWGDSVLSRVYRTLQNFNSGQLATAGIVQDFNVPVFKLENLVEMIAQNQEAKIVARMNLAMLTQSVFKGIVLQKEESYERANTNVSGVSDLVKVIKDRLVTASGIPHTILFGEGPGGALGGTGTSEKMDWYDQVKHKQVSVLEPLLLDIIRKICLQKEGITGGKVPEGLTIEFFPLWQPSEKELLEARKLQADIDAIYIDRQVYYSEEVAKSRFGSGEYSIDTKIDFEERKKFEEEDRRLMAEAEANAAKQIEGAGDAGDDEEV